MALEQKLDFADLLALESVDRDIFRGRCHEGAPMRAFGGQVAAQAQTAAGRTVEADRRMHSLHGYFLRPGRTDMPIVYLVDRLRDGRSFTTRRVDAVQDGETIFSMSASFQVPRDAQDAHQMRAPDVRLPRDAPSRWERMEKSSEFVPFQSLDIRVARDFAEGGPSGDGMPRQSVWVQVNQVLSDDPLLHVCALTYLSDVTLAATALRPHADRPGKVDLVSLDHAVWFHRPFRVDDWLLFEQDSPILSGTRGLSRGTFFTRDGQLVASVVQEAGVLRR
ncbi:acyl-CoA thioesterase II [Frankia sp. AiPa1]|uniref:acyl-CoA thioesterase n=1 Tax=Frankia sp. AiPa1 TaxID=573492 RepID=UPI00202B99A1|nr:acyl-CoA thioesterase II [Frankia sp. AiPa1]